jgi:hypothetical protein
LAAAAAGVEELELAPLNQAAVVVAAAFPYLKTSLFLGQLRRFMSVLAV